MSRPFALNESTQPLIVASISTEGNLKIALQRLPREVDLLEIRADCWAKNPDPVLQAIPNLQRPLLLTVRNPAEGGQNALSLEDRQRLFELFLPSAWLVDVEERSLLELASVVSEVKRKELPLIVSYHDFEGMPSLDKMQELSRRAAAAGAAVFKIAATPREPSEVTRMLDFLTAESPLPLAVMGMGKWGRLSRLACASLGSVLNYGYLDSAQAPGQWPADLFGARLAELNQAPDSRS